jgi:hypothetical protein
MPKKKKGAEEEAEKPPELAETLAVWNDDELDGILASGGDGYSAEAAELLLPEPLRERVGPRCTTCFPVLRLLLWTHSMPLLPLALLLQLLLLYRSLWLV